VSFDGKKEKNERCVSSLWLTIALTASTSNSFLNPGWAEANFLWGGPTK